MVDAVRQAFEPAGVFGKENVGGVRALEHGGELEAGRHVAGQVLQAVDGDVDRAGEQRVFELLGEEAFAAGFAAAQEREVELLVAARDEDFHLTLERREDAARARRA